MYGNKINLATGKLSSQLALSRLLLILASCGLVMSPVWAQTDVANSPAAAPASATAEVEKKLDEISQESRDKAAAPPAVPAASDATSTPAAPSTAASSTGAGNKNTFWVGPAVAGGKLPSGLGAAFGWRGNGAWGVNFSFLRHERSSRNSRTESSETLVCASGTSCATIVSEPSISLGLSVRYFLTERSSTWQPYLGLGVYSTWDESFYESKTTKKRYKSIATNAPANGESVSTSVYDDPALVRKKAEVRGIVELGTLFRVNQYLLLGANVSGVEGSLLVGVSF